MSYSHNKYIAIEATVSAFFNAFFSFCIAYLTFQSLNSISVQALIVDALPQSFFVTFFSVLVPTLLTRRRLLKGSVSPLPFSRSRWPKNILLRAAVAGIDELGKDRDVKRLEDGSLEAVDDVGFELGYQSFWGPGRHILGSNWFWYFKSPFGCNLEYDADMDLHDDAWTARDIALGADNSQAFLLQFREKWFPMGPPPKGGQ